MTLGEKIYKLRNERNMTQEQLAEKLGVTRQSISKWEGDLVKPEIEKLKAMAKLFEVSLDDLISDEAAETKTTKAERFERNVPVYKFVSIITAGICLVMIVIMIAVATNLSDRIRALELTGFSPTVYEDNDSYTDDVSETFSDVSWKIKDADKKKQQSKLHIEAELKTYRDSTEITAIAETDSGKQYTAALENSSGMFRGDVAIPISGEQMKITLVVDNGGEKQKVVIDEGVYMLEGIALLPDIDVIVTSDKGNTHSGIIYTNIDDIDENETALAENIEDVKVFIKNKNKVVFEKSFSALPGLDNIVNYSFDCDDAEWDKDFEAGVSYYDKSIGKTVEIYGSFDPTLITDDTSVIIGTEEYSYDDNYHITLK